MTEEMSISADTFRDWLELSRRDDCLGKLVPSDVRLMLGEITRLRQRIVELKHALALKGKEVQEECAKVAEAKIHEDPDSNGEWESGYDAACERIAESLRSPSGEG